MSRSTQPPEPIRSPARDRLRRVARVAALLLVLALLGVAADRGWRWYQLADRLQAGLPGAPVLTGRPAALEQALAAARDLTAHRATAIAGTIELGRLFHANGFLAEAEACWRLLRAEQPREARWSYLLADLRRSASDYPGMEAFLRETTRLAPDYAPAWLRLAEFEFKRGEFAAAGAAYRRRLELLPTDPFASLGLARIARQAGDGSEAARLIEKVVAEHPGFPAGHSFFAELLAARADPAGARLQRWLAREGGRFREPADPWLQDLDTVCLSPARLYVLGTAAYQIGAGDRGRAWLERAVELVPEDPASHELLGDLYVKLGEPDRARTSLECALELWKKRGDPPPVSAYVNLADTYRRLNQPQRALALLAEGLDRTGGAFELHNSRGVTLDALGREAEAIAAYREAVARAPHDADANFNLAVSLLGTGQRAEAVRRLQDALTLQPTFPKALSLLARLEAEAGNAAGAWRYLQPLYEAHPGVPQVARLVADWYRQAGDEAARQGDPSAAERNYREGLVAVPDHPELNASLGVQLLTQGRFSAALGPLETLRRLRPEDPQGALFLGQAYAQLNRREEARRVLLEGERLALQAGNAGTARFCREILNQL